MNLSLSTFNRSSAPNGDAAFAVGIPSTSATTPLGAHVFLTIDDAKVIDKNLFSLKEREEGERYRKLLIVQASISPVGGNSKKVRVLIPKCINSPVR